MRVARAAEIMIECQFLYFYLARFFFFLIAYILLEYVLHFQPRSSTIAWLCCELRNIYYTLPAGLHFILHPFILGCVWLWVTVLFVLQIPSGSFRKSAGVETSVLHRCVSNCEINGGFSGKKKKNWGNIGICHRSSWVFLFTPLTERNSYLNLFGFTENLWERNWVNMTTGLAGVHKPGEVLEAAFCCSLKD